jgi:hypothetical protein
MLVRVILSLLIVCTACKTNEFSGIKEMKCPEFKSKKLRKNYRAFRVKTPDKSLMAKKPPKDKNLFQTDIKHLQTTTDENFDLKPIIHKVDVEEMDCPKPYLPKNLPRSVKQNIKKNTKKIRTYFRNKTEADSAKRAGFKGIKL